VAIEAIKQVDGRYLAYIDNGREETGVEVIQWARQIEELGAGELIITSVDREGTAEGFDIDLIKSISNVVNIPVIAHGGASTMSNIIDAVQVGNASALAIASIFHYASMKKLVHTNSDNIEGNNTFKNSGKNFSIIEPCNISDVKNLFKINKIPCRPIN